ncbi:hypothetical protein HYY75_00685 [bacterium]|nr:hypothetical protein [bacterium]
MKVKLLALRVAIFFIFSIFLSITLMANPLAQPSQIQSDLKNLLSGSTTDFQEVPPSLDETDLPAALAIACFLKFKSLHGETKLTIENIEQFKNAVEKRLKDAKTVYIPTAGDSRISPTNWIHVDLIAKVLTRKQIIVNTFIDKFQVDKKKYPGLSMKYSFMYSWAMGRITLATCRQDLSQC